MQKKNQGFTLIELMIVVAIVAILAAVAIPAYQDYIKRSKVSEVAATAGACKTSVAEYVAATNTWPGTAASAGCTGGSQYVSGVTVGTGGNGIIRATASGIGTDVTGYLQLAPVASGTNITGWSCTGTIPTQFRPGSCRG